MSLEIERCLSSVCMFTKMDQVQPIDVKFPTKQQYKSKIELLILYDCAYYNKYVSTVLGSLGFPLSFEFGLVVVASFPLLPYTPKKKSNYSYKENRALVAPALTSAKAQSFAWGWQQHRPC